MMITTVSEGTTALTASTRAITDVGLSDRVHGGPEFRQRREQAHAIEEGLLRGHLVGDVDHLGQHVATVRIGEPIVVGYLKPGPGAV